jgi:hypothetical protein
MPVIMTTSLEPEPERTELSTQKLPTIPTVQEMETWDEEKVLRWIRQRKPNLLKGNTLENFNNAEITGSAFLLSSFEFFKGCDLSPGASLVLNGLVDEVKEGKFIPRT